MAIPGEMISMLLSFRFNLKPETKSRNPRLKPETRNLTRNPKSKPETRLLGDSGRDDLDVVVVQVELRDVLQIHYLHTRHILLSLLLFLDYNYQTRYLYSQTPLIIFTIKPVIMTFKLSIITFKTVQQNSNHQVIIEA